MAKDTLEVTKSNYLKVPFTHLFIDEGLNFREDYGDIKGLTDNVRENGVQEPLRGWVDEKGWYHIMNGHRRYKAMENLYNEGIKDIRAPFMIVPKDLSDENTILQMFVANDGKPFTMLEQATGIEKLEFYGLDSVEIAKRLGKSRTHIENMLKLAKAPVKFKKLVKNGTISATYAIDLLKQGEDVVNAFIESPVVEVGNSEEKETSKKTAKVTKKSVSINSFTELKEFAKAAQINEFPKATTESFYWLLQDLAANKIQKIDLLNFFTDGTYEQKAVAPKKQAKAPKVAKPAKEPKPAKQPKAVKEPKAAKPAKKTVTAKVAKAAKPAKGASKRQILYKA